MKVMKKYFLSVVVVLALAVGYCHAAIPGKINYQGKLTNATGQLIDGTKSMTFKFFDDATAGTEKWTETHGSVVVTNGLFNVMLGSDTGLTPVFQANDSLYLEIAVAGETLSPRQEMASVGYALKAGQSTGDVTGWTIANETWTYKSADDPTYVFDINADGTAKYYPGMRIKCTNAGAVVYGIVTAVGPYASGKTPVTIYGGTDYNLANSAITLPCYSAMKAPAGFPLDPSKWTVEASEVTTQTQNNPTQNTYYNFGTLTLSVPIGIWYISYSVFPTVNLSGAGYAAVFTALSTSNNSVSDVDLASTSWTNQVRNAGSLHYRTKTIVLTAKTAYYLITKTDQSGADSVQNVNAYHKAIVRAVCAYL